MAITKEQWNAIEQEMKDPMGRVVLKLEGRQLSLEKCFIAENKLAILVFIDGTINPGWGWEGSDHFDPFVKRVWRQSSRSVYKPSEQARIIKNLGKRLAKKTFPDMDKKLHFWLGDFKTAVSMRRTLQKNKEIELVSIGYVAETA